MAKSSEVASEKKDRFKHAAMLAGEAIDLLDESTMYGRNPLINIVRSPEDLARIIARIAEKKNP